LEQHYPLPKPEHWPRAVRDELPIIFGIFSSSIRNKPTLLSAIRCPRLCH
jgi:hypothetical protein